MLYRYFDFRVGCNPNPSPGGEGDLLSNTGMITGWDAIKSHSGNARRTRDVAPLPAGGEVGGGVVPRSAITRSARKIFTFLALFLLTFSLSAQDTRGVQPINQQPSNQKPSNQTRAVIVGISNYQDPGIPDLKYADRDAQAFADWLRSPAGGGLDEDHLKVLTDAQATAAKVAIAFDWLIEVSREGDVAFIYFSGHGDVESKKMSLPGFLLCWDSPATTYTAGGTYSIYYLQDVIQTLSVQNKVKVIVVTDACHSGKLAGNEVNGSQLTNANLQKQFGLEVKIMSCQPNEYSIEGAEWGGGRGAFSYHLVDGLYGYADRNADQTVNLFELDTYLGERVPQETAPHPQFPFAVGDKTFRLARVDAPTLAQVKQGKSGGQPVFMSTENRGLEDEVLASVDTSVRALYRLFKRALKNNILLQPVDACADAYYRRLIEEPKLERLHSTMRRNLAAALVDESQQVTNKLLKTDPQIVSDALSRSFVFDHIPAYLQRAIELLGEQHYMFPHLMAKKCFFEAKTYREENYPDWPVDSLYATYQRKLNDGLQFDSLAAFIYLDMAMYYTFHNMQFEVAIQYGTKAIDLAPNCAAAYFFVGNAYGNSVHGQSKALPFLEKAISIDSTFLPTYIYLGLAHGQLGNHEKYQIYLNKYVQGVRDMIAINPDAVPVFYYNQLGNALWKLGHIEEAEKVLLEAEKRSNGQAANTYLNLRFVHLIRGNWQEVIRTSNKMNNLSPPDHVYSPYEYELTGFAYRQLKQFDKAEEMYKRMVSLFPPEHEYSCIAYRFLGDLYLEQEKREEAESVFEFILNTFPEPLDGFKLNAVSRAKYVLLGKEAMQETINQALRKQPDNYFSYAMAANVYALAGMEQEALDMLEKSVLLDPNTCSWMIFDVDSVSLRPTEGFKALCRKCFPYWTKD